MIMNKKFEDLKKIVPNLKVTNPQDLLKLKDLNINSYVKNELVSKLGSAIPLSDVANIIELGAVIKMIKDILTPEIIEIKPFVIKRPNPVPPVVLVNPSSIRTNFSNKEFIFSCGIGFD